LRPVPLKEEKSSFFQIFLETTVLKILVLVDSYVYLQYYKQERISPYGNAMHRCNPGFGGPALVGILALVTATVLLLLSRCSARWHELKFGNF
jgi:hypothetical protein